jgi:hypothetical protein
MICITCSSFTYVPAPCLPSRCVSPSPLCLLGRGYTHAFSPLHPLPLSPPPGAPFHTSYTHGSNIAGTIALSGSLIDSLDALYNARIPLEWLKKSWQASTLGNWFLGLLQRHEQLHGWLNQGRPRAYWLPGFFNPQVGSPVYFEFRARFKSGIQSYVCSTLWWDPIICFA